MTTKVKITQLSTGVPGLDAVLGGGLPEFSFNLVAGPPGRRPRGQPCTSR
jgi:circadian clock protein KaiC